VRDRTADPANIKDALQIRQGSLYPALYRLENKGWLKAEWKTTDGGRDAKFYSVTKAGSRQLRSETEGWKRLCDAITLVLDAESEGSEV